MCAQDLPLVDFRKAAVTAGGNDRQTVATTGGHNKNKTVVTSGGNDRKTVVTTGGNDRQPVVTTGGDNLDEWRVAQATPPGALAERTAPGDPDK